MLLWLIIKLITSEIDVIIDIPKMERIGNIECNKKACWSNTRGALKTTFSYYSLPNGQTIKISISYKRITEANTTFDAYLDDKLGFTVNRFLSCNDCNDSIRLFQTKNYDLTIIGSNFLIDEIYYRTALAPSETPIETPTLTPIETPIETPTLTPIETPIETPSIYYQKEIVKDSNKKAIVGLSVGLGLSIFFVIIIASILLIKYKRKQVSEKEIDDDIKYPSDESKKEEEQSNPLYEYKTSHDPFAEIEE